jgi:hypothetical protein
MMNELTMCQYAILLSTSLMMMGTNLNDDGTIKEFDLKSNRFKPLEYLCEDLDADDLEEIKENEDE